MDNLCHTLTGAALGEAGLNRRTRFGTATLMIAANIPDIDVAVFAFETPSVAFRRGWTHGIVAQVLLPALLTGLVLLIARVYARRERDSAHARRGGPGRLEAQVEGRPHSAPVTTEAPSTGPRVSAGWLLILSYIGIYSHVFLDYLNTYGVRLLAPIDWRWFYGDAVFIIDVWLWLALGAGVLLARRRQAPGPARAALVVAAGYIVVMLLSGMVARQVVAGAWREARGSEPGALMVGPVPLSPFTRDVIVDAGAHYERGTFSWWPVGATFLPEQIPKNDGRPEIARAVQQSRAVRGFLVWSRFPFWTLTPTEQGTRVTVTDARFMAAGAMFAASTTLAGEDSQPD